MHEKEVALITRAGQVTNAVALLTFGPKNPRDKMRAIHLSIWPVWSSAWIRLGDCMHAYVTNPENI
jgi:hypothetical protein